MNPFPDPFLPRSGLLAVAVPMWRHWKFWLRSPEFRAWLHFNRRLSRVPRRRPGMVDYRRRPIHYLDAASFLSGWHEIFVAGLYEIPLPVSGDGRPPLLIDAGANIGLAPLFWKMRCGDFRYVGFEADPAAAAVCRRNLAAWDCAGTLHEAAVAGQRGRRRFGRDRADAGALDWAGRNEEAIEVETVPLSEFLTEPVDLLKLDIEGAESEVLAEIEPCLHHVQNIFVEFHARPGAPQTWGESIVRLQRAGFRCHVRPLLPHWRPFMEASPAGPEFDEQFNLFAVREPAAARSCG
jgi:FkbM family methyltransferase